MDTDRQKLLSELKANPKVRIFLSEFEENSANQFLEDYVDTKQLLLQCGEQWRQRQHNGEAYFRACAEEYYWQIAKKKLFNLQCLWRAEKIDLPISTTYEFNFWSNNIRACSFIESTNEVEIDAMIHYLENLIADQEKEDPWDWQAYDEFKDEESGIGASDCYPDWYEAYDNYMGTQDLMTLPDIRGKKEKEFLEAWRTTLPLDELVNAKGKPFIFNNSSYKEEFIRKTESYKIQDYYRLYQVESERQELMEKLEFEINILKEEQAEVHIPEGKFPDAIFQAGHLLKVSRVKSLLPEIHQNHLEQKSLGISYPQERLADDNLVRAIKERIEIGKRLLGED